MIKLKIQAAASNGSAAVLVGELGGLPTLVRYAPSSIGEWKNRAEFASLVDRACAKMGWKRDLRCKSGYRKIVASA